MKDNVENGHLTTFDDFTFKRDHEKLWTLRLSSKSIQTSLILRLCPPKPYKLLTVFAFCLIFVKMGKQSDFQRKVTFIQTLAV